MAPATSPSPTQVLHRSKTCHSTTSVQNKSSPRGMAPATSPSPTTVQNKSPPRGMTPLPLQNNFSPRRILSNLPQAAGAAGGQGNAATPSPGSSPAPTSSSTTPSPTWTRWAREASPRTCTSLKHISIHVIHLQLIIIMKQTRLVSNLYQSLNHFVYCVMYSDVLSIVAENSL